MGTSVTTLRGPVPVTWLLEGPAYVRYRTLIDILGHTPDRAEVRETRAVIPRDLAVRRLLEQQNAGGYWGTPEDIFRWWPNQGTTFWVLGVLADLGLTRDDPGIEEACEYVLGTQLPSGAFGLRPPPKAYDCFTGVLTGRPRPARVLGRQASGASLRVDRRAVAARWRLLVQGHRTGRRPARTDLR